MKHKHLAHFFSYLCLALLLTGCGFHLQNETKFAPPLHHLYLQASDPYGTLAHHLKEYLQQSNIKLVNESKDASAILVILSDATSQDLLGVSGTQQTRQYALKVTVIFEITDRKGRALLPPQTLIESRIITIQSNQVLGSSNESNLFYQQMRRSIAYAIINRIASKQGTTMIMTASQITP